MIFQDPDIVACIDALPNFFAIEKGKEVTHEVLLRPLKFRESSPEAQKAAIARANSNTESIIAKWTGVEGKPPRTQWDNTRGDEMQVVRSCVQNQPETVGIAANVGVPAEIDCVCTQNERKSRSQSGGRESDPTGQGVAPILRGDIGAQTVLTSNLLDTVFEYILNYNYNFKTGVPLADIQAGTNIEPMLLYDALQALIREKVICEIQPEVFSLGNTF